MQTTAHAAEAEKPFSRYQIFVIALLGFLQFTIILDFMILSPLGAILMQDMKIPAAHFGLAVSVYAFSAGASGLLTAGFADRFDRKKLLIFFYTGFILGTFLCGIAPNYPFLIFARIVTGLFGGVIGSVVMAIVADLFPLSKRGRVMGVVQTAFAASQVLGIPLGLYFSNLWGWHAPFLMICIIGLVAGIGIVFYLRPIDAHMKLQPEPNALRHLFHTVSKAHYLQAFAATTLMMAGGFMLMPFGSAFSVHNLGIPFAKLPTVYMITGIFAIVAGPVAGRLSDRFGKYQLFLGGTLLTMVVVLIFTRMGISPLWQVILINVVLFAGITSRMIPSQALMSAVPVPRDRGAFMSVNAAVAQFSGGIAAAIAGLIVVQRPDGTLGRYDVLGYVVVGAMTFTAVMLYFINRGIIRRGVKGT